MSAEVPSTAHGIGEADFSMPGTVYQMGLPPFRIDILTEISGVGYEEATRDAIEGHLAGLGQGVA